MDKSIFFRVVLALVLVGAVIGLGALAFNAGVQQGISQAVQLDASKAPVAPYPPYAMPYGPHFFGFGLFGILITIFLVFMIFRLIGVLVWGGHRGWGHMHHGPWGMHSMAGRCEPGQGFPPFFEEWHRRAHEKQADDKAEK